MSLVTPLKVEKLQMALHAKAKEEPEFRFYQLYDKLYRNDVLEFAYRLSRSKKGKPGIDGKTFDQIESEGVEAWLGKLTQELQQKTYKADPLRRVWLDKPDGTQRPLGIPTIRDRVVMTAAVLVLAPIFEPDLQPEQYAYRKGRNAHDAVRHVHSLVNTGHTEVVDADLSGYFDTIPHAELMTSLARLSSNGLLRQSRRSTSVAVGIERPEPRMRDGEPLKVRRSRRFYRACICVVFCWDGKHWVMIVD